MQLPSRQVIRRLLVAPVLVLAAGWILPYFFSAERYRRRLEAGLERALHRPVTFGAISLRLLPHPGFSIENAVVREDPAFGSEPFAHVERIDCDLKWRSLWHSQLDFARLTLKHPSLNIVRSDRGEWNYENLLLASGITSPPAPPAGAKPSPGRELFLEADEARINFKMGPNKKPFAITDLNARLVIEPARRLVRFRLEGKPIRMDLPLPSPGALELEGEWTPGSRLEGPLNATLSTRGALLYDWVPIVTGYNPEIYGVLDAEIGLSGSARVLRVAGHSEIRQLHRWGQLPPSDPMPVTLYFRGELDRQRGRALLESMDLSFADSRLQLTGSLDGLSGSPSLDLVFALGRSRLEDVLALSRRFWPNSGSFNLSGRVDGLVTIQGPWTSRRTSGFLTARDVRLGLTSGTFPVSDCAVRIDTRGARLAPVKLTLAPRVEVVADATIERFGPGRSKGRASGRGRYEVTLSAKAIPLRDLFRFGRAVGIRVVQNIDAQGIGTADLRLSGPAWPFARPSLAGRAEIRAARLLIPGLTEPLNLPRARVRLSGEEIVVDPVVAVIGTSVFSGRLQHQGNRQRPWKFDLRASNLSLEEGALWFDVLGRRRPVPLLERLPGLSSVGERRASASNLFGALNARGRFSSSAVSYRALVLKDFRASVEISGRVVRISDAAFRAGGGRGRLNGQVNLTSAPPLVRANVNLKEASLQSLASRLPVSLQGLRGLASGTARIETRGLTREEMRANLQGQAVVRLKNVSLGDFDPLEALARRAGWGLLEPSQRQTNFRELVLDLRARSGQVMLEDCALDLSGAKINLAGAYGLDGTLNLDVQADLRHVRRQWISNDADSGSEPPAAEAHLAGTIDKLEVTPGVEVSRRLR